MKRSPFYPEYVSSEPTLVGIQGWEVPNVFTTPQQEHEAVRNAVGLLDWSTTGEFEIQGPDALDVVQKLIVNDAANMPVNRVLYTTMLNDDGDILSDITVYRLGPEHYMLMTAWGSNAADERPEYELLRAHSQGRNAVVYDSSPGVGLVALQGPKSRMLLRELTDADLERLKYMWALPAQVAGIRALISRTGYTGELGYEVLIPAEHAHDFWGAVTAAGAKHGLALVGMVAAFSLRMEKGYIMRFDFAGGRTPYEVGLGWTVKLDKGEFIGREALARRKAAGFQDKLVAIKIEDGYVPPSGDALVKDGAAVGETTSAAFGYTVGTAISLGYVPVSMATPGVPVEIRDGDGNLHPAAVSQRSPYDPEGTRLRA
jgi:aminomethyltransferase